MLFLGEYKHQIDAKNRIFVPVKFRDQLGSSFIATRGLDQCLFVYPLSQWKVIEEKITQLSLVRDEARAFMRLFLSGANECSIDSQGRILITQMQKDYARLEKDVQIIGVGNRVEIWSCDLWNTYKDAAELSFNEIAGKLTDLDI